MFFKYLYVILFVGVIINNIHCDTTESIAEVTEGIIKSNHSSYKSLRDKRVNNRKIITDKPTEHELSEKQKKMTQKCIARMEKRIKKFFGSKDSGTNVTEASFPQCDYSKRISKTYSRPGRIIHSNRRHSHRHNKYVKINKKPTLRTTRKSTQRTTQETTQNPTHTSTTDNIFITTSTTNILLQGD